MAEGCNQEMGVVRQTLWQLYLYICNIWSALQRPGTPLDTGLTRIGPHNSNTFLCSPSYVRQSSAYYCPSDTGPPNRLQSDSRCCKRTSILCSFTLSQSFHCMLGFTFRLLSGASITVSSSPCAKIVLPLLFARKSA